MRLNKNKKHEIIKTDINVIENKKYFGDNYIPIEKSYKSKDNIFIPKIIPKNNNLNHKQMKNAENEYKEQFLENIKLSSIGNEKKDKKYSEERKKNNFNDIDFYNTDSKIISKSKTYQKMPKINNGIFKSPTNMKKGYFLVNLKSSNNENKI